MTEDLAQIIPLGAAIRALEQAKSPEEVVASTLRLQSALEQLGPNPSEGARALTMAASRAVETAIAYEKLRAERAAAPHSAAASVAAAYRHSIETLQ